MPRPAGRTLRATKREYMRLKPLRPVPGRDPSRQDTGRAAAFPAATTKSFIVRAGSGYCTFGGRPVPA